MSQDAAVEEGDKIRTLRVRERQPRQRDRKVPAWDLSVRQLDRESWKHSSRAS